MDFSKYVVEGQMNIFDFLTTDRREIRVTKPIRTIELFAGYGSQAMAFKKLGVPIQHHFVCEFDKYAIKSYNAIHGTDFEVSDIKDVHGSDLNITDTDKYTYFMSYSFPCTDLSVAGKMKGMEKGSGTRSGLLWEVERILQEIVDDDGELPQILMMENVTQVHGKKNLESFEAWLDFLESIGYYNVWDDLNSKHYGIPQNRNRTFVFSFLRSEYGEHPIYEFPKRIKLDRVMKDILEDEVEEKYYINSERAKKLVDELIKNGTIEKECARS